MHKLDFTRLYALEQTVGLFIACAKPKLNARRVYFATVARSAGLTCYQRILRNNFNAARDHPLQLRRIRYRDLKIGKHLCSCPIRLRCPC